MALLLQSSSRPLLAPQNPTTLNPNSAISSPFSVNLNFSTTPPRTHTKPVTLGFNSRRLRIKCCSNFNQNDNNNDNSYYNTGSTVVYPRPSEIPWRKELCNTVELIGVVGVPVEFKLLNSGKALAWTRLAVRKSATDTTWINLTFWEELAHIAHQHVEKGQRIFVSGRLIADTVEGDDEKPQTYYKVVVQQLNFIENTFPASPTNDRDANKIEDRKSASYASNNAGSTQELWQAFFANPVDWWDNRRNKKKPKISGFQAQRYG